ncbi:MAG: single-stranded-DNA-specific exonuclease RecJ, partial [Coriobacteriales bacterium]|nr:single-stranded-DNA-specific exonuclease RecJ [Coriobacteriales bacterium]
MTPRLACPQIPWVLAPADEAAVTWIAEATGLSAVTSRILASRGIDTEEAIGRFLAPSLDRDWLPPSEIPGMAEAAASVADAVRAGRRIVVFGDFDLDGISAAAVATRGLRAFGADVAPFVPRRFDEGYGLTSAAIERVRALGPQLLITVDCGISASPEVAALVASGIDVVVTDHHEPGDEVPTGVPVANPKLDTACGSSILAGAGVALKLVQAVGELLDQPDVWRNLVDLATLGTVADVVPLVDENRALVAEGVRLMAGAPRAGIAALARVAGVESGKLDSGAIAFALAPRLNAAGRMADPVAALELLLTDDPTEAAGLAEALDEHNRVRQAAESDLSAAAFAQAESRWRPGQRGIVVAGEGWHEGVKGIVASRLVDIWRMPALVFSVEDGIASGSGRSFGSVDLFAAVATCSEVVDRFGGHSGAVGVQLPAARLPEFRERFLAELAKLDAEAFVREECADAALDFAEASVELVEELRQLAPFGCANPTPRFATCGVFMTSRQRVGRSNNHLRFAAYDGRTTLPAIAFRAREIETLAEHDAAVDLLYDLEADEWRGKTRLQLLVRDVRRRVADEDAPAAELVDELFARADAVLAREEYTGIDDAPSFYTKLAGVTFEGRQELLEALSPGTPLRIERRPDNPHDVNACALIDPHGHDVGWFNRRLAAALAPVLDAGVLYDVAVTEVTGGDGGRPFGVNVLVERRDGTEAAEEDLARSAKREALCALDPGLLEEALVREFIGDGRLHEAQAESLRHLADGRSTLLVMATGRGKSLVFHLHAAREALSRRSASVFVFPLRALVADQAFHLQSSFGSVGLAVRTVTGETAAGDRDAAFADLAEGRLDVVLTTPEFLEFHAQRFADAGRVGFVVVDEAHHVGLARASHRPAYARLGEAIGKLGDPTVLAATATAGDEVARAIRDTLGIESVVLDPSVRENLRIEDHRDHGDRDAYLCALVARGGKTIVYVNSREQSVRIARTLRKRVPDQADRIAFYNGGLTRPMRHAVESAFREGEIASVVATSAFGEGVNIPDVRNVVLYHLPFNEVEFNQMCGRAGRNGQPAHVHLLFGGKDARINQLILGSLAPSREDMAALYLALRDLQRDQGPGFEITNAELCGLARSRRREFALDERGVSSALGVLRELGLLQGEGTGIYRRLTLCPAPAGKVEL